MLSVHDRIFPRKICSRDSWCGLFDTATTGQGAYYLVYPTDGTVSEPFVAFRKWLFEVLATYVAENRYDNLG